MLFVVDVHAKKQAINWIERKADKYDLIIVGGDLCTLEETSFMFRFLEACLIFKEVLFVPGNNDPANPELPTRVKNLHGKKIKLWDITIGGLGGSNKTPFNTRFELEDNEAEKVLSNIGKVDVLVSHCPPYGTKCDLSLGRHVGSIPVRNYIEKNSPKLVLSGHVHESRALDRIDGTTVLNPGPLMYGNYAEIMLESLGAELRREKMEDESKDRN